MQKPLILFGTRGCHLCDDAERILQALKLPYQYIDIIDDEKLLERYQTNIPVLQDNGNEEQKTLFWPFTMLEVGEWWQASHTK